MADVEEFFRKNIEIKKKPRGENSFVAPHNNHTYQVDIVYFKKGFESETKIQGWISMY